MTCQTCGAEAQYIDLNSSDRFCRDCIVAGRDEDDS